MSSSLTRSFSNQGDRFIPNRSTLNIDVSHHNIVSDPSPLSTTTTTATNNDSMPPPHHPYKSSLSSSLFGEQSIEDCDILTLKTKPPKSALSQASQLAYHQNNGGGGKSQSVRHVATAAEKVLDAPGLVDDYYLNLLDWSQSNVLCVALGSSVYLWNATTAATTQLLEYTNRSITSLSWSPTSPHHLAVGTSDALVEIWDISKTAQVRSMSGHHGRVASLSWNGHLLSSGAFDGGIHNHDLRQENHLVRRWERHAGEVCGLRWSNDGRQLASGGNDNMLMLWEVEAGSVPRWVSEEHVAAVKAISWCPWLPHLLATGGGSADRTIKFWNTLTGTLINSIDTESQVCGIQWSKHHKELITCHGFSKNQLTIWKYPSMTQIAELRGHTMRVVQLAMSPDGTTVCSGSSDETLRFWRVFEPVGGTLRGGKENVGVQRIQSIR